MKANIRPVDRILRLVAGIVLAVLYFTGTLSGTAGVAALVVGIVLVLTALLKFCPLYRLFGACSCSR